MNDSEQPSVSQSVVDEADSIARKQSLGWATRLWELAFLFLIATVTTIDFSPYVVWKLPILVRIGMAVATLIVAAAAALVSKAAKP
jgi:hypothetical protein